MNKGCIVKTGYCEDLINIETLKDIYGDSVCYSDDLPYKEITFKSDNS